MKAMLFMRNDSREAAEVADFPIHATGSRRPGIMPRPQPPSKPTIRTVTQLSERFETLMTKNKADRIREQWS
jgi:hypothetical protein